MAMKKKLIVGITAALVTAMCLGGSAFAAGESTSVNGSGNTDSQGGETQVTMQYTKPTDGTPVWSVNIPKAIDFGSISPTSTNLKKELNYTAAISNENVTETTNQVAALKLSLPDNNTMTLNDSVNNINIANAYSILNTASAPVAKSDNVDNAIIATLTEANPSATAYAQLNTEKFKSESQIEYNSTHAFSGSFSILVTPVADTAATN